MRIWTLHILQKAKRAKLDVFLGTEDFKNIIETLNKVCIFIKENNQHPIKIQNQLIELITLYIGMRLEYHLIIVLQGLIEWTEKIYENNNEPEKENAFELHTWILKQATRLYYSIIFPAVIKLRMILMFSSFLQ